MHFNESSGLEVKLHGNPPGRLSCRFTKLIHRNQNPFDPCPHNIINLPSFQLRKYRPFLRSEKYLQEGATFPSLPEAPSTAPPSSPPCKTAPAVFLSAPSPIHSPESLSSSPSAPPPGSQNTDPQETTLRSPGAAACDYNIVPSAGLSPAPPRHSLAILP